MDLAQACILFGSRVPLLIAAGLLGRPAFHGGAGTYALGIGLHFFIALAVAAIYVGASRRLTFLTMEPLGCGLFSGAGVELVMRLVVLRFSALQVKGPFEYDDLVLGLLMHMVVIGLPVAYAARWFVGQRTEGLKG